MTEVTVVKKTKSEMEEQTIRATSEMCYYCFDVLQYELAKQESEDNSARKNKKRKNAPLTPPNPANYNLPDLECPLFVGWHKHSKNGGNSHKLRGCKGTHGSLPLSEGLKTYALLSAFDDSRFEQIRSEEVPRLSCSVSLLYDFEKVNDCYDWEVGTHGVRIDFYDSANNQRSATFLPHVAVQFGYNQKQTIERLVEKAGCNEPVDNKLAQRIKTIRFKDSQCELAHEEYLKLSKSKSEEVERK